MSNRCALVILYDGEEASTYVQTEVIQHMCNMGVLTENSNPVAVSYNEDEIAATLAASEICPKNITPEPLADGNITIILNAFGKDMKDIRTKMLAEILNSKVRGYDSDVTVAIRNLCGAKKTYLSKMSKNPGIKPIVDVIHELCAGQVTISPA